jgi:hypothetical protein
MQVSRRAVLKAGALTGLGTGSAIAAPALAARMQPLPLVIFDSRIAESVAFSATQTAGDALDLAQGTAAAWRALGTPSRVTGLTRWSDWTALRGALEEQGLRVQTEQRVAAPLSGRDHLFCWSMALR